MSIYLQNYCFEINSKKKYGINIMLNHFYVANVGVLSIIKERGGQYGYI
jgi:hypothetical protein